MHADPPATLAGPERAAAAVPSGRHDLSPLPHEPMNDERPPRLWWGMWKRFLLAAVLIVALSAGATATVALNTVSEIADEVFPKLSQINAPKGL